MVDIENDFSPLERQSNESAEAYHKRLIYGKLVDKTLSDFDYTELSEYVYGKKYSCDVARRMMYGSCKTLELIDEIRECHIDSPSILNEIEMQKIELRKERQRFFDQRREFNKLITVKAREENIHSVIKRSAEQLNETVGTLYSEKVNIEPDYPNDAILVLSDWHYGLVANNVFNTYNTEICKYRVSKIINDTIKKLTLHKCNNLHIVILGDMIHGGIHTSSRVASEELICDQLMQVSEIIAQSISKLNCYVENTYVYVTYGNHARTIQNKGDSIHRDNIERMVPWWLTERLKDDKSIKVVPERDDEFILFNSCNHEFIASHGDLDSIKSSPRLLGSLFAKKYGSNIEYVLLGDKHHTESFEEIGISSLLCGSLCGTDDYSNSKRLYSTPSQLLLIVNSRDGVDAEYRIKCE